MHSEKAQEWSYSCIRPNLDNTLRWMVNLTTRSHQPYGSPPVRTKYEAVLEAAEVQNKVKFTLEQATKTQRGSRDVALPFL